MNLSTELKRIIDQFGINILVNPNFTNYLADFGITNQFPFVAPIIKDLLANSGAQIVAQYTANNTNALKSTFLQSRNKLINDATYNKESLILVIDSLASAVGISLPSLDTQKNTAIESEQSNHPSQITSSRKRDEILELKEKIRAIQESEKNKTQRNILGTASHSSQEQSNSGYYHPNIKPVSEFARKGSTSQNKKSNSRSHKFDAKDKSNNPGCNSWKFWFSKSGCITVVMLLAFLGIIQECTSRCSSTHETSDSSNNTSQTASSPKIPTIAIPTSFVDTIRDSNGIIEDIKLGQRKKDVVLKLSSDTLFLESKYEIMNPTIALCFDTEVFNKEKQELQRDHIYYFQLIKHDEKEPYPYIYGIEKSKFTKVKYEHGINDRTDKIFLSGMQHLRNIVLLYPPKNKMSKENIEKLSKTGDLIWLEIYSKYTESKIDIKNKAEYRDFDDDTRIILYDYFATMIK